MKSRVCVSASFQSSEYARGDLADVSYRLGVA